MELWQCRRCGTWIAVDPTIVDLLLMRTLLCHDCFAIETREALQELRELNKKPLKVFREVQNANSGKIQDRRHGTIDKGNAGND